MEDANKFTLSLPNGPIKQLVLTVQGSALINISMSLDKPALAGLSKDMPEAMRIIARELRLYSEHAHNDWTISLPESGTAFQRKVWSYLQTIPMGTTQSYGEVATALSSSARAVGNACRANPYLLVVPCHRVVKSNNIGGFGGKIDGQAIAVKQWLLTHEKR